MQPRCVGFGTFVAFLLVIEAVIRIGWLNRFIVPPPSEIIASFGRLFIGRAHCLPLLLHGGRMLHRRRDGHDIRHRHRRADAPLQSAAASVRNLGRGIGVGAVGADLSAVHGDLRPQRLDHHHDGFRLRAAAGDPQDDRGHIRHAQGAGQRRAQLQADADAAVLENPVSRPRCRPSSSACGWA